MTSEKAEYGEPWTLKPINDYDDLDPYEVKSATGKVIFDNKCDMYDHNQSPMDDDAQRIVACINACASIPNPAALPKVLALLQWQIKRYPGDVSDKLKDAFKLLGYTERPGEHEQ